MPYLRVIGVDMVRASIKLLKQEYNSLVSVGRYPYFAVSVLLMYLFSVLEDIVAIHVREEILSKCGREDGMLVSYSVFRKYAVRAGLLIGVNEDTLKRVVFVRNLLAHNFVKANRPFNIILEGVSATECAKLFKNAFNSVDMDNETRLICNELLYDLFRRDGMQFSHEFEQWMEVENALLRA